MSLKKSYSSNEDARSEVINHCCNIGINIRWKKSETKILFAVCRTSLDCPFAIYISYDAKTDSFLLRRYNADCIHMESSKRHLARNSDWSADKYSTILKQTNVSSSVIISIIKEDVGIDVTPSNICKARKYLVKNNVFENDSSFQYIRSYCSKVTESGGFAVLDLLEDNTFRRVFICHEA